MATSVVTYPIYEITSLAPEPETFKLKLPSSFVAVLLLMPFSETVAPDNDDPILSITFPETVLCWLIAADVIRQREDMKRNFLILQFFDFKQRACVCLQSCGLLFANAY